MQHRKQFRVGLFLVACIAMFVVMLGFVVGSSLHSEQHRHFILFEENVKGMVVGSKVNFQGVPIGAVTDIRFQEGMTRVEVRIDPTRAVIQDVTRARLDRLLVTGQVTVELEGFDDGASKLGDGAEILTTANPIQQITTGLPEILAKVDGALDRLVVVLDRAQQALDEDNLERFESVLSNLDATTAGLPLVVEDARALLTRLDQAASSGSQELAITAASARAALAGVTEVREAAVRAMAELESMLGSERPALHALVLGARDAMREVHALARQLRQAPSSVIRGTTAPELAVPATPGGPR